MQHRDHEVQIRLQRGDMLACNLWHCSSVRRSVLLTQERAMGLLAEHMRV